MKSKIGVLIVFLVLVLGLGIYLNRSYARIYSYDQVRDIVGVDMRRNYVLEGGSGTKSIKYVALGDSLTYGFGARNYQETFPYIISQNLLSKYKKVEVVNLAVSGAVLEDVLDDQLSQGISEKPDLVTVLIGTNDVHDFIDKEDFKSSLSGMIQRLKDQTDAQIILINIPYLGTSSLILPPHDGIMNQRIQEFNQIILEVAQTTGVKYFDLYSKTFDTFKNDHEFYSVDGFHPSGKGYILWGNLINAD